MLGSILYKLSKCCKRPFLAMWLLNVFFTYILEHSKASRGAPMACAFCQRLTIISTRHSMLYIHYFISHVTKITLSLLLTSCSLLLVKFSQKSLMYFQFNILQSRDIETPLSYTSWFIKIQLFSQLCTKFQQNWCIFTTVITLIHNSPKYVSCVSHYSNFFTASYLL